MSVLGWMLSGLGLWAGGLMLRDAVRDNMRRMRAGEEDEMKRRDMRELVRRMAEKLDELVAGGTYPVDTAADIIDMIREMDAGMGIDANTRRYTKALQEGRIVLEKEVVR